MIVETFKIMESFESFHLPPKAYKLNLFKLNRPSSALMKSTENNQELRCSAFSPRQNLLFNAFRAVEFKSQLLLHFEKEKKKKNGKVVLVYLYIHLNLKLMYLGGNCYVYLR